MRVQRKAHFAREREVVHCKRIQQLPCFDLRRDSLRRSDFRETVGDEEDEDNEQAVGGALDLEVSEERVGTEEVKGFVDYVGCVGIGWIGEVGDGQSSTPPKLSDARGSVALQTDSLTDGVGRTAYPGLDRQHRHVANDLLTTIIIERRMVRLQFHALHISALVPAMTLSIAFKCSRASSISIEASDSHVCAAFWRKHATTFPREANNVGR